mmetsp:Transcript_28430/g.68333  ORF Transcript_28430/g.68333 Transcript_28430/m.68333 type:complete len:399 (-) Transcript_28430:27-1223(-)
MLADVIARLRVRGLRIQALMHVLVRACYRARAGALSALAAAHTPFRSDELVASSVVLALLLGGRFGGERTPKILPGAAYHLARLDGLATLYLALTPLVHDPPGSVSLEIFLHCQRRGQGRKFVVISTSQWLLADQSTLRLGAAARVAAIPRAPRRLADVLARQDVLAVQMAHRPCALGRALRGRTLFTRSGFAHVFGTENRAMGSVTINVALRIIRTWTARLAPRLLTIRGTILIADRLRAIPGTMGVASLSVALHCDLVDSGRLYGLLYRGSIRCRSLHDIRVHASSLRLIIVRSCFGLRLQHGHRSILAMRDLFDLQHGYHWGNIRSSWRGIHHAPEVGAEICGALLGHFNWNPCHIVLQNIGAACCSSKRYEMHSRPKPSGPCAGPLHSTPVFGP